MCACVFQWLTSYGQKHGDGREGPSEALAAHKDGAVPLGQQTHQAKQAALQHSPERWNEEASFHVTQSCYSTRTLVTPALTRQRSATLTYS